MTVEPLEKTHPNKREAGAAYARLVGIDEQKGQLLDELQLLLRPDEIVSWQKKHHSEAPELLKRFAGRCPAVLLSGDVGCGKSVLARSVATPLAEKMGTRIKVLESPTDLRGGGHVGELSARLTELFRKARTMLQGTLGLLILDEADDLAATRAQDQAHHEDRAGVNVLIKQLDHLSDEPGLAVILITNRLTALDPAVVRRASLHLHFERPVGAAREALVLSVFPQLSEAAAKRIAAICERDGLPFAPSDITDRLFGAAARAAWREDKPLTEALVTSTAKGMSPSPAIDDRSAARR